MEIKRQGSECILVVDSEVLVRHAISDYLRSCGYTVIEAANSDEAKLMIAESELPIAAMLCEGEIRGSMNSFELRRWVQDTWPDIKVILAGNMKTAANAAARICDEGPHLKRPYDPQGVVEYIRQSLTRKTGQPLR